MSFSQEQIDVIAAEVKKTLRRNVNNRVIDIALRSGIVEDAIRKAGTHGIFLDENYFKKRKQQNATQQRAKSGAGNGAEAGDRQSN